MAVTYSSILRLNLIVTGTEAGTWGDITNGNLGTLLEQAIASSTTFSVAAGDVTLTATNGSSDQSRCMALRVTGSPGVARNIIVPTATTPKAMYIVANGSNNTVTIKTGISIIVTSTVAGAEYRILSLGTTTQAQWNTLAGTTGVSYSAGSVFTATGAGVGNGTVETAGVTVPSGSVFLVYYDTTFSGFRFVGQAGATANTPNTLVLRDASGNFAAGIITATTVNAGTLTGSYSGVLGSGTTASNSTAGESTPRVANTAFVQSSISSLVGPMSGGDSGLRTISGNSTSVSTQPATPARLDVGSVTTQLADYASGASTITLRAANALIRVGQKVSGVSGIASQTFVTAVGTTSVNAGSFIVGVNYTITNLGNTDWNVVFGTTGVTYSVGMTDDAVVAGSGTGTAYAHTIGISPATTGAGTGQTLTFRNVPANDSQVILEGTLPTGFLPNTFYFVINSGTDSFNVSLTSGGAAVVPTTSGSFAFRAASGTASTTGPLRLAGTLGVGYGGTGTNSLRLNNLLVGNGTSSPQFIPAGATNNVLTSVSTGTVGVGSFVVGTQYTILNFGTTTNANWNTIAGTTGVTYTVGSVFTAASAGTGLGDGTATTNVWQSAPNNGLTLGTAVPVTTGTTVSVTTTIPSWVRRITLVFEAISANGNDNLLVRLGTSSTVLNLGYNSAGGVSVNASNGLVDSSTTGFIVSLADSGRSFTGTMTIALISGTKWISSHSGRCASGRVNSGGGVVDIGGTLTQIQLALDGGNSFDGAGLVNILYD